MVWQARGILVILRASFKKDMLPMLAGILCLSIGLTALMGWYTHTPKLFQIRSDLTPMYFNTALSFVLLGGNFITVLFEYKKWTFGIGSLLLTITGLTLLEYIFGINLGIDELFFKTNLNFHTASPGRMSFNSALSFFLCGTSLILFSLDPSRLTYCMGLFLSICVLSLASISLLGYAAHLPATSQWAKLTPMAAHTSLAFMIATTGLIFFVYTKHATGKINLSSAIPYFSALFVFCLTILLWRVFLQQEIENIQERLISENERIQDKIKEQTKNLISELEMLKFQWQILPTVPQEIWLRSAEFYRKEIPWYTSIEWLDSSFYVRGVTPLKGNESLLSLSLDNVPFIHETLEKAKREKRVQISRLVNLIPKGRGFLICVPLFKNSLLQGAIIGTIDADLMFKDLLKESITSGFNISIFEGPEKKQIFSQSQGNGDQDIHSEIKINLYGIYWLVKIGPSLELYKKHTHKFLSLLILFTGMFVAFLLFITMRSRQTIKEAKQKLNMQLLETSRYLQEMRYLKDMTDALQTCVSLEDSGKFIEKYCKLFFPSTSGIVYLANNSSENVVSYAYWGPELQKPHSFLKNSCQAFCKKKSCYVSRSSNAGCISHIKTFDSTQIKDGYICIPLFDQNEALGLLHIHDEQILSQSEDERVKKILIAETFAKQLSLCLTSLKMRDLLREQAVRDPLTGLFNRRYLEESLQRELHRAERQSHSITLIMLDIDHFKMVNDTYGHEAGDAVLKNIAIILQESSRKSDIACRFGGEEFILILPETTLETAIQRAEVLRQAVMACSIFFGKTKINNLSISLGIASFPQHGHSAKEIITEADQALYKAKALGRNRVVVAEKIHEATEGETAVNVQ